MIINLKMASKIIITLGRGYQSIRSASNLDTLEHKWLIDLLDPVDVIFLVAIIPLVSEISKRDIPD